MALGTEGAAFDSETAVSMPLLSVDPWAEAGTGSGVLAVAGVEPMGLRGALESLEAAAGGCATGTVWATREASGFAGLAPS